MSDFTYQEKGTSPKEYYEWDRLWFDNAPDETVKRAIVIGDSISCGYRRMITQIANGRYFVDGIGTSKAADNPSFIPLIDYFMSQTSNFKVILINNGLHGWFLSEKRYEEAYTKLVNYISKKFSDCKLVMITSTPVRKKENLEEYKDNYERILERNRIALKIAEKYNMTICDLFSVVKDRSDVYAPDGIHLEDAGYELLAKECDRVISTLI